MNIDIGVLEETKIDHEFYTRNSFGYEVVATKAVSAFQDGIALVYLPSDFCMVEYIRLYSPNVIS
jgi:hypothetical protein